MIDNCYGFGICTMIRSFVPLLILLVLRGACAVTIRPLAPPRIRPLYLKATFDMDTNITSYYMRVSGPSDTRDKFNMPLLPVAGSKDSTIFEARVQIPIGESQRIELQSKSASEMFRMLFQGRPVDGEQSFTDQICEFELTRKTEQHLTEYSVENSNCTYNPERSLDVFTYFTVGLQNEDDVKEIRFDGFENSMKDYVNRTSTSLILNEENMRKDRYQLIDAHFWVLTMYLRSAELVNVLGWNVQLV